MRAALCFVIALSIGAPQASVAQDDDRRRPGASPPDTDINLPRYLSFDGWTVERRTPGNGAIVYELYKVDDQIIATTERATTSWFVQRTVQRLEDPDHLASLLKADAAKFGADQPRKAPRGRYGPTVGYFSSSGNCEAFAIGYRLRKGRSFDNDEGNADLIVKFAGCNALNADLTTVITSLRRTTDEDRAALLSNRKRGHSSP